MTNLYSLLKSRDITLLTKACIVKLWFFQESCTNVRLGPQKVLSAEELMLSNCGAGGLLRVPWTARRSNQSVLKEINLKFSFEVLLLKLRLQYFGYPDLKSQLIEKTLMLGKIGSKRRKGSRE